MIGKCVDLHNYYWKHSSKEHILTLLTKLWSSEVSDNFVNSPDGKMTLTTFTLNVSLTDIIHAFSHMLTLRHMIVYVF